jgi:UDP-N-acetylglucosamine:LPS N-acetylglucosamine transferase
MIYQSAIALFWALRLRPRFVVSLGASDVVPFCYWAKLVGAKVFHVECMNQVVQPSITGRLLYPICDTLYVQWEELLPHYGPRARYAGWVL